jgi:hypothetical protein
VFMRGRGRSPRPRIYSQIIQKAHHIKRVKRTFLPCRVRDSSGKPAVSVANEDLQRIARPEAEGRKPYLRRDTPKNIPCFY